MPGASMPCTHARRWHATGMGAVYCHPLEVMSVQSSYLLTVYQEYPPDISAYFQLHFTLALPGCWSHPPCHTHGGGLAVVCVVPGKLVVSIQGASGPVGGAQYLTQYLQYLQLVFGCSPIVKMLGFSFRTGSGSDLVF